MKKKIILIIIFFCSTNIFAQKNLKENSEYSYRILEEKILLNEKFKENLPDAEFKIAEGREISSVDFNIFIDEDDGSFTTPKISFVLNEGLILEYIGLETWNSKSKQIKGHVFSVSSGQKILFVTGRNGFNPKLLQSVSEDTGEIETFEFTDNDIKIICKTKIKFTRIILE